MGVGWSDAISKSTQVANANISNQYAGSCDITCNNTMDNVSIALINSQVGGDVDVTQSCSVNGQCMFDTTQNATTDVIFKAANSANAASAIGTLSRDYSYNKSYQEINQNVQNSISQECNLQSSNDMDNVTIFAANSQIGGSVVVDQSGNVTGGCTLQAAMTANALASGTANNCAAAGKKAIKACSGKGGFSIMQLLLYVAAAIVIFIVVMIVMRLIRGPAKPAKPPAPRGYVAPGGVPTSSVIVPTMVTTPVVVPVSTTVTSTPPTTMVVPTPTVRVTNTSVVVPTPTVGVTVVPAPAIAATARSVLASGNQAAAIQAAAPPSR